MSQSPQTEYHHYIPQFLLRRFAITSRPLLKRVKGQRRLRTNEKMVNVVDLTTDVPTIGTTFVKKTFGEKDMYMDHSKFEKPERRHMETKLSHIERDASRIIARVVDAHTACNEIITLSRSEKDLLRKFLFIMKYRSPIFWRRFNHQTAEEYDSSDRNLFLRYMQEEGLTRPLDVWFDNLLKIIDAEMDPAGQWTAELAESIYPPDAEWLFDNIRSKHLAFVTPSDRCDEFILTDNAFSIHEGPVSYTTNRFTGKQTLKASTEFHLINVISPQLAMILRDNLMPEPLEDGDADVRDHKKAMLAAHASMHTDPENARSFLSDLPIAKARNSYTTVREGRLMLAEGADGKPHRRDKFYFKFFQLESRDLQMINTVMLDQAHNSSTLVFGSKEGLRKALEFYLDYPSQAKGGHSIKTITDRPDDPMLLLFQKLESVARTLGSDVKARYHVDSLMDDDNSLPIDEAVYIALKTAKPIECSHPLDIAMSVMLVALLKMHMNVSAVHELDLMKNELPTYPELVYNFVRQALPEHLNEYTKNLPRVDLQTWTAGWDELVQQALRQHSAGVDDDNDSMQKPPARLYPDQIQRTDGSRTSSSGLSRRGLMKGFDAIGLNLPNSKSDSTVPAIQSSSRVVKRDIHEADSSRGFIDEASSSTLPRVHTSIDMRTVKGGHDEVSISAARLGYMFLAGILLAVVWWLA